MTQRSNVFKIWGIVLAILGFIAGIGMGFLIEPLDIHSDFNWWAAIIFWISVLPVVLLIYAIYVHISNQETLIVYANRIDKNLEAIAPQEKNAAPAPAKNHTQPSLSSLAKASTTNDFWICPKCSTKNSAGTPVCKDCGTTK